MFLVSSLFACPEQHSWKGQEVSYIKSIHLHFIPSRKSARDTPCESPCICCWKWDGLLQSVSHGQEGSGLFLSAAVRKSRGAGDEDTEAGCSSYARAGLLRTVWFPISGSLISHIVTPTTAIIAVCIYLV